MKSRLFEKSVYYMFINMFVIELRRRIKVPWVPEVSFSLETTEFSDEAAKASREAARKKPLVPTDNNLTSMPTPISFD